MKKSILLFSQAMELGGVERSLLGLLGAVDYERFEVDVFLMRHSGELLPYLCRTNYFLAELMHAKLIRTQTEALGGSCCDYWYVGDKSPALEQYRELEQI